MNPPSAEQKLFYEQAASQYQSDLAGDTYAQGYLAARGISKRAADTFRLGVARHPLTGHEGFAGRLAIPYITPKGGVVNFSFRCLRQHDCKAEDCPKYLALDGADRNLYSVGALNLRSDFLCVAEGELDTIILSVCDLPAVGVPGVDNWQTYWGRCLGDYGTVYVFADGDSAGRKLSSLLVREVRARPVPLPPGEDVNSLYLKGGADGIRGLLKG